MSVLYCIVTIEEDEFSPEASEQTRGRNTKVIVPVNLIDCLYT